MSHTCQVLGEIIGLYKYTVTMRQKLKFLGDYTLLNYVPNTWNLTTGHRKWILHTLKVPQRLML